MDTHLIDAPSRPRPLSAQLAVEQWNVVFAGLNRIEHGLARPVFDSLWQQLRQQPGVVSDDRYGPPAPGTGNQVSGERNEG